MESRQRRSKTRPGSLPPRNSKRERLQTRHEHELSDRERRKAEPPRVRIFPKRSPPILSSFFATFAHSRPALQSVTKYSTVYFTHLSLLHPECHPGSTGSLVFHSSLFKSRYHCRCYTRAEASGRSPRKVGWIRRLEAPFSGLGIDTDWCPR